MIYFIKPDLMGFLFVSLLLLMGLICFMTIILSCFYYDYKWRCWIYNKPKKPFLQWLIGQFK